MESIYYSISWYCHRECPHCYDNRFRPYAGDELAAVIESAQDRYEHIIDHFPDTMRYQDLGEETPEHGFRERVGRIILSGGEVLAETVREPLLYPAVDRINERYRARGGVRVVIQTAGDHLNERIVDELLARGVWMISVAGMDGFHKGMTKENRKRVEEKLSALFDRAGMTRSGLRADDRKWLDEPGPLYSFFGATRDSWIGKLWPGGRAWENDLSTAVMADNFCNAWSGGLGFLSHRYSGSEVAVDPDGNVFPCCRKTKLPLGNLCEESLFDILDSLAGHPVFEAITTGAPERMGLSFGWGLDRFFAESEAVTPKGRRYRNRCIGCDRFHEQVMAPVLADLQKRRRIAGKP